MNLILNKKNNGKLVIATILSFFILSLIITQNLNFINPSIKQKNLSHLSGNGSINLTKWDFRKSGPVALKHQWKFSWGKFLSYKKISSQVFKGSISVSIPHIWKRHKLNGHRLPSKGFGTYYLKVHINKKYKLLSLFIPPIQTSSKIYINNTLISTVGIIGRSSASSKPNTRPNIVTFIPPHKTFYIIIQASNYFGSRGGILDPITLGSTKNINSIHDSAVKKDLFLIGVTLIIAIYYLSIYFLRRNEKTSLYFSLMCLMIMLRTSVIGSCLIYDIIPGASFNSISFLDFLTIIWTPAFFAFFIFELFSYRNAKAKKLIFSVAILETLITLILPPYIYTMLAIVNDSIGIAIGSFCIYLTIKAYLNKQEYALTIFISGFILGFTLIYDTLLELKLVNGFGEITPLGFFIFIFLQAFILARKFSKDFIQAEKLSIKLQEMLDNEKILTEKLTRLDKLKDEFLANTSHELRTPLNGIVSITEGIIMGAEGSINEMQKKNLSLVVSNGKRLSGLINDILDISRLKNNDLKLNIKENDIRNIIFSIINVFKYMNTNKEVQYLVNIPEKLPLVLVDDDRFSQIIYNLIGNATKFTARGNITITAEKADGFVQISVKDTGEGIPEDKLGLIWNAFEQVDSSLTRKHGGVGLGLAITKKLVELHGGTIKVSSEYCKGTSFSFSLPTATGSYEEVAFPEDRIINHKNNIALPERIEQNGPEILVVDDDIINLYSVINLLKLEGYSITSTNSGIKALELINNGNDYSLVILDVMMPEISGYEVCKDIRETYTLYELPVLMLTAYNQPEAVISSFASGANDFLCKPFETNELIARTKTLTKLKTSVSKALNIEMAYLQAQIKPHFIFNVLNTIVSLCHIDSEAASDTLIEFSNYLRYSFDFSNLEKFIPLSREIEYVNCYLYLEKKRFGDKLITEISIDIDTEIMLPPLILQPIVENAVKHGIRHRNGSGLLRISVREADASIIIAVWDNGNGIPKEKLDTLFSSHSSSKSVGLKNINLRLKRLYGSGLQINSTESVGTEVKIIIPKQL